MSITINTDLQFLMKKLNISEAKMQIYGEKTIEQILEAEAAQGNQAAVQLAADMFTNTEQLIELFRLSDVNNRLIIMKAMNTSQLKELVPMLETDDLVQGLQFFTEDRLLDFLEDIPKEELLKTVFQMFSEQQIINFLPEKQLDKLLTSSDIMDKGAVLNSLKTLPQIYLQQILESVTGEEAEGNSTALAQQIGQLDDNQYKSALLNLKTTQKQELTLMLTSSDKKLYQYFDSDEYTNMMARERDKIDIVKAMDVIQPEHLHKMITQLPNDLLATVTSQIDTKKFADALINKFPELLAQFVAA